MSITTIRVKKNTNYSVISNVPLQDNNLSLKAKGLLAIIVMLPEDTDFTSSMIMSFCKDSKRSISAGLKELKEAGYIQGGAE